MSVRTDAETFIDVIDVYEDDDTIYRLYITGNDEDGFKINGEPAEDISLSRDMPLSHTFVFLLVFRKLT